jgi:hypothetical protein
MCCTMTRATVPMRPRAERLLSTDGLNPEIRANVQCDAAGTRPGSVANVLLGAADL